MKKPNKKIPLGRAFADTEKTGTAEIIQKLLQPREDKTSPPPAAGKGLGALLT